MPTSRSNATKTRTSRRSRDRNPAQAGLVPKKALPESVNRITTREGKLTLDIQTSQGQRISVQAQDQVIQGVALKPKPRNRPVIRREVPQQANGLKNRQVKIKSEPLESRDEKEERTGNSEIRGRRRRRGVKTPKPRKREVEQVKEVLVTERMSLSQGDEKQVQLTKTLPKSVEVTKGVSQQPVTKTPSKDSVDYIKVEKIISDLYDAKCALKREDISNKADFIRDVVEKEIIMKVHESDGRFTFDILRAGSYYEHLKVGKPNEFDIMLCLKGSNIEKCFQVQVCPIRRDTPHLGGFAYLRYLSHKDSDKNWDDLLIKSPSQIGRVLSSQHIVGLFRNLISERCKKVSKIYKDKAFRVKLEPTIQGPAVNVTFIYDSDYINVDIVLCIGVPGWPSNARRWQAQYSRWPSRKVVDEIKSKGFHVVPKLMNMNPQYWRLSFSLAEKSLLSPKAIEEDKKCYRIIKFIFEVNKLSFKPLCSYFLKTLFLHLRAVQFSGCRSKIAIVIYFFKILLSKVKEKKLQHFFILDVNLFSNFSDNEARRIALNIERILLNFRNTDCAIAFFKGLMHSNAQS